MMENYLYSVLKQFEYYKILGEKTFDQISDEELHWEYNADSNTIAIIVNHITGNMKSRWTDFLTADGEKEWRNRDMEFEPVIQTREQLIDRWEEGWQCLFTALHSIDEDNYNTTVYIRSQSHTIAEAVNRQMMHYAYHIGQIVYIGRQIKGSEWISLSIAKGQSQAFNHDKIAQGKHDGHFTDDIV